MNHFIKLTMASLLMMLFSIGMFAQQTATGSIKGDDGFGLIGVSVIVKGTTIGTTTDLDGNFSIRVPDGAKTLVITYTGFETQEIPIDGSAVNLVMSEGTSVLDEVVVSGLATNVKRSNSANNVASISAAKLTGVTSQTSLDGALAGKFKGAEIRANSGAPGGGISVRMRGVTSLFLDPSPLYVIDGIYVNNGSYSLGTNVVSAAAGGGNTSTNQDDASNRIADIDPEDIATIEILKGASAAAIYGARAAGGVVIIETKKGKNAKPEITFKQTIGFNSATRLLGTRQWDAEKVGEVFPSNDPLNPLSQDSLDFLENGTFDYEEQMFGGTAMASTSRLELAGGDEKSRYFIGTGYKNENGIVDNTGHIRGNVRLNFDHKLTDWFKFDISSYYSNGTADRGFFNNSNSNTTIGYAMAFTKPWQVLAGDANGNYPGNPAVGSNFLETIDLVTNRELSNRLIGGAKLDFKLFSNDHNNLKLIVATGIDQLNHRTRALFPQQLSYFRDPGTLGGASVEGTHKVTNYNLGGFLVHSLYAGDLNFRTTVGLNQISGNRNSIISTATGLNGSQTSLSQAANTSVYQFRSSELDKGGYFQEEINWDDKIILTGGIRADKSSNNGDENKLYYYPKANIAINIGEFGFWSIKDTWNAFKIRAAYGQSGRFAGFNDRFTTLGGSSIGGLSGLVAGGARGNDEIAPERQSELEFGTDIGFFNNRLNLDVTYYTKTIDDLFLNARIPTSTGFSVKRINGGALQNKGIEIGLKATPVKGDFTWNTGINWWKNASKVTRLDVPAFNTGGFAASLGQFRIQEGESATQIVGTIKTSDCVEADCSDLDPDGDGFRVYGNAEADFNMGFDNSFTYKGLQLTALFHWKKGGDGINLSTLLYDLGGTTWDYDDTTLDPTGTLNNGDYRTSEWFAGNTAPWVEDNGYLRLREVGLFYTIPTSALNDLAKIQIGLSGRNLVNIFDYNSYDPEVSNFGGAILANNVEVTPFPASKTINIHLKAKF